MTPLTEEFKGPGINDSLNENAHLLATVLNHAGFSYRKIMIDFVRYKFFDRAKVNNYIA